MPLQAVEGLPLPLNADDVDRLIVSLIKSIGTVAIQSQHLGNCASDSIQIAMFFSDGIGDFYRKLAVYLYNNLGADLFALRPPETSLENIYKAYVLNSIQRFLKLVSSLQTKAFRKAGESAIRRTPSSKNIYAAALGKHEEYGVECSLLIGKVGILLGRVHRNLIGLKNSYSYHPDFYNPLKNYIMSLVTIGRAEMFPGTGNINRDREGLHLAAAGKYLVGVQVYVNEAHEGGNFHTFTLIKIDNAWFIGDNEVGLLSQRTPFTDDDILNNTIRVDSLIQTTNGDATHARLYTFGGHKIGIEYKGTGTAVPYANAIEKAYTNPGKDTAWGVRSYYVYTRPGPLSLEATVLAVRNAAASLIVGSAPVLKYTPAPLAAAGAPSFWNTYTETSNRRLRNLVATAGISGGSRKSKRRRVTRKRSKKEGKK
jgi:hypothetical protein